MANLRRSFEGTLRRYGHNVYLQRRINEYDGENPQWVNQLERHTVRHTSGRSINLPEIAMEMSEGIIHDTDIVYYFKWDANPQSGDRIYENIDIYPHSLETFLIDKAIPMRGLGGQIVFWTVGASQETPT